jgi:putative addiction module component (TIGR02574 family)
MKILENLMDSKNIIQNALSLSPAERLLIIEALSKSLSEPDMEIDKYWKEEVEKRYNDFIKGKHKSIPYKEILKK